ncbi:MAG: FlgD immunoglobulin-like domain containing protein [Candidatus Eisenbacteria bacterium]
MRPRLLSSVVLVPLFIFAAISARADCIDYEDYFHLVTRLRTQGASFGIDLSGNYAYLVESNYVAHSCMEVVDVSDPLVPLAVASLPLHEDGVRIDVSGNYAYVTEEGYGQQAPALQVIDVTDPRFPQPVGLLPLPPGVNGVAVLGTQAFVANGREGLQIVDVSDPASPRLVGNVATRDSAIGVAVRRDPHDPRRIYAYVADGGSGLTVIEAGARRIPRIAGSASFDEPDGEAWDVVVVEDYAYIAGGFRGLFVFDVSDPTRPTLVGHTDTAGWAYGVAVSGARACIADANRGLQVIDVSDPADPRTLGSVASGYLHDCIVSGDYALVAELGGFEVIDVSGSENAHDIGSLEIPGQPQGVTVSGHYAYFGCGEEGLQVLDLADPENPVLVGSLNTGGWAERPVILGSYAYLMDGGRVIRVIDVSDPAHPVPVSNMMVAHDPVGIAVDDRYAYVSEDYDYFEVFDLASPEDPVLISHIAGIRTGPIVVAGDYAYMAARYDGLRVVWIADPYNPVPSAIVPIDSPIGVCVSGNLACVVSASLSRVIIIDITVPHFPQLRGSIANPWLVYGVAASGDDFYVASEVGLEVIDTTDLAHPRLLGQAPTPDMANGVDVGNGLVCMSLFGGGGFSGLDIFPIQCPDRGAGEGVVERASRRATGRFGGVLVRPNPMHETATLCLTLPAAGAVRAAIHDASGRVVRIVQDGVLPAGPVRIDWDGRAVDGHRLAAGFYWAKVSGPGGTETAKIVIAR